MKLTHLYIKQHSVTGLKYFGKTTKEDPVSYLGSGIHWKRHIKKHGTEHVKTLWYQSFQDEKSLIDYATKFSKENNIVESKEWANLKEENGLDGGMEKGWWSEKHIEYNRQKAKERWANGVYDKEKLRLSRIGFKQPQSQKDTLSKKLSKTWEITNPAGEKIIIKNLRKFAINNGLDQGNMSRNRVKGWKCLKLDN
jgi:hypothetical protein